MTNYTFMPTGIPKKDLNAAQRNYGYMNGDVVILTEYPSEYYFEEVGLCTVNSPDGLFSDGTERAYEELKECALENGGNAVFIEALDRETTFDTMGQPSNNSTRITGKLLRIDWDSTN
ncbi:MAG: hypothetical protein Kapaf2KO_14680 [Candidatus Kapaibacteriales bacterium]